jgi:DNA-binding IclR family transcriptional regulator
MKTLATSSAAHEKRSWPDPELRRRIRAEFREMPGLRLTLAQASRFFHLERSECERLLSDLVRCGELRSDGSGFMSPAASR